MAVREPELADGAGVDKGGAELEPPARQAGVVFVAPELS